MFDRCRRNAIARLSALLWRMPPQPYFEESVGSARSRPSVINFRLEEQTMNMAARGRKHRRCSQ